MIASIQQQQQQQQRVSVRTWQQILPRTCRQRVVYVGFLVEMHSTPRVSLFRRPPVVVVGTCHVRHRSTFRVPYMTFDPGTRRNLHYGHLSPVPDPLTLTLFLISQLEHE